MYYIEKLSSNIARISQAIPSGEYFYIEMDELPEGAGVYRFNDKNELYVEGFAYQKRLVSTEENEIEKLQTELLETQLAIVEIFEMMMGEE